MKITRIVIHCTDSPQGRNINASTIHQWHVERGWSGIGYHHVILEDGTIEDGRPHWWEGAHAKGFNKDSIGICLVGEGDYTIEQLSALFALIGHLKKKYPEAIIAEHRYLNPEKGCPLFNAAIQSAFITVYGDDFYCVRQKEEN